MNVQQRNEAGAWSLATPLGWLEEHPPIVRAIYAALGISHCGRKGWRA